MNENEISYQVIGAAIEVNRLLGPGLLESAYEACLARELEIRQIPFERQVPLPVEFKGIRLECGYRMDFVVGSSVVVEVKAIEAIAPVHHAQALTYLRFSGKHLCLLLNFNVANMKEGIRRIVLDL